MSENLTDEDRNLRMGVQHLKERFSAYRTPQVELPAEHIIEEVVKFIFCAGLVAGLERAATVCETNVARPQDTLGERWAYDRCAAKIREILCPKISG